MCVAGELGHTKAVPGGRLCGCGERGCLEAYCGGHNLSAQVAEAVAAGRATTLDTTGGRTVGAAEIEKAALAGDALAKELWDNCQRLLSVAIANFTGSSQFEEPTGSIAAGAMVITVPIIVFVLVFQRRIVAGLTSGAVKG